MEVCILNYKLFNSALQDNKVHGSSFMRISDLADQDTWICLIYCLALIKKQHFFICWMKVPWFSRQPTNGLTFGLYISRALRIEQLKMYQKKISHSFLLLNTHANIHAFLGRLQECLLDKIVLTSYKYHILYL